MVTAEEAKRIIFSISKELPGETVKLVDALHRVLGNDVRSHDDIPPFRNSSMDGFALRSVDTLKASAQAPVELSIQQEIAAGDAGTVRIESGRAIRILTGAPVPEGADTVIPLEQVVERDGHILVSEHVSPKRNVREQGEDIRKGEVVLKRGTVIRSAHLGVLASVGCSTVEVVRKPALAILTTGNELLSVGDRLEGGKIRNSNAYSLYALAAETGAEPIDLGVARDDESALLERIREGLRYDFLVTSGGISAGKYDYVLRAMQSAGVDLRFWKVNIKPGMPLAFGVYSRDGNPVPVFCLPGNPVSTVVTFLEFVQPFIFHLMGISSGPGWFRMEAILDHEISKNDGKKHYHRAIVTHVDGDLHVRSTGNQSSGVLTSLVKANCLMILDDTRSVFRKGEKVTIELLPWSESAN